MLGNLRRFNRFAKICYIDLFSGSGKYVDGTKSTPILILESVLENKNLSSYIYTLFNDADQKNIDSLISEVKILNKDEKLKFTPIITCAEIDDRIITKLKALGKNPKFTFLDPYGYVGISRTLIQYLINDWGSDCLLFFNYERINAGLTNDAVRSRMNAIFGEARVDTMRQQVVPMKPRQREQYILDALASAVRELGGQYVVDYRFRRTDRKRTSHALVFVTKNELGYRIMKDIMAHESSIKEDGVASYKYDITAANLPLLPHLNQPLELLQNDLLVKYAGKTLSMIEVYDDHHVGKKFVKSNYKMALMRLESNGNVKITPPEAVRRQYRGMPTLGDDVLISFPEIK